ncbi:MAG TPA: SRPBCC family protein [Acidimicrobiia bacterium]
MSAPFATDGSWEFAVTPDEFWATVERTDMYTEWWSWLREFECDGLFEGALAKCLIRAPLPYSLDLSIAVIECAPAEFIMTRISGDLDGDARLEITPADDGCSVRLMFALEVQDNVLRQLARFARPMMVWAHDRVIDTGLREFERRALTDRLPESGRDSR